MNALIVYSHPEPASFNGALRDVTIETLTGLGHGIEASDLYAEGFDPAEGPRHYRDRLDAEVFAALGEQRHASTTDTLPSDVAREIARLERADLVVFQFPLWWHGAPAMLKGWFDRVFVSGGLYTSTMRYDRGYFRPRRAILSVTTGAPAPSFSPKGRGGGTMEDLLWPTHYSLHYMGFSVLPPFLAHGVQGHGYAYKNAGAFARQLDGYKRQWATRLETLDGDAPLVFPGWDDWDEDGRAKTERPAPTARA